MTRLLPSLRALKLAPPPATGADCNTNGGPRVTGAGVALLEDYNDQTSPRRLAVLVFRARKTTYIDGLGDVHLHELPGGGCDNPNDPLPLTASRELNEETSNMFWMPRYTLETHGVPVGVREYRVYFLRVAGTRGIYSKDFRDNTAIIAKHAKVPHPWREMDDMARIYVDDVVTAFENHDGGNQPLVFRSTSGQLILMHRRDAAILRNGLVGPVYGQLSQVVDLNALHEVTLHRHANQQQQNLPNKLAFLQGTTQYRP